MSLLLELGHRIPDRWFLRRLLPAALFVAIATAGIRLKVRSWHDAGHFEQRLTAYLNRSHGTAAHTAQLLFYALLATACAFVIPLLASLVNTVAVGAWPWWTAPLARKLNTVRANHWQSSEELRKAAVENRKNTWKAARFKARAATALPAAPTTPTWIGDRLAAAANSIAKDSGIDVHTAWPELLLTLPEPSRTTLSQAREGYQDACEALAWSAALVILAAWWWPALVLGVLFGLASWRWLRRATEVLAGTAEAAVRVSMKAGAAGAP